MDVIGLVPGLAGSDNRVWQVIAPALAHGSMDTIESLQAAVRRGDMQMWAVFRATELVGAVITEVTARPLGRVCCLVAAAGEGITADGCEQTLEQITPWARSLGCEQFEINGRPGWGRHLDGWKLAHTTHRRAI